MGNTDKNREFKNVCRELNIILESQKRRSHLYIEKNYKGLNPPFRELLKIGKEFLEYDGGVKRQKHK